MRVGVIRSDINAPLRIVDLEPVSQWNPPTEPRGQERYLARPTTTQVEKVLASPTTGAGAAARASNIAGTLPITLTGSNNTLRLKVTAAASYTDVTIATGVYTTMAALAAAVNVAVSPIGIVAYDGPTTGMLTLESKTRGVASYLSVDTVLNGSTGNTILGLAAGARTVPAASAYITAGNPVGGPINVATATMTGVGSSTSANALALIPPSRGTVTAIQDTLAPMFSDTDLAVDSYLVGMLADYRNSNFNPDSRRKPAIANGPAIAVVADDGSSAYTVTLPTLTSATLSSSLTIGGTGLGSAESAQTSVKFAGKVKKVLSQSQIVKAGGSVTSTQIVVPASLVVGVTAVTTTVQVKVRQRVSGIRAVA